MLTTLLENNLFLVLKLCVTIITKQAFDLCYWYQEKKKKYKKLKF